MKFRSESMPVLFFVFLLFFFVLFFFFLFFFLLLFFRGEIVFVFFCFCVKVSRHYKYIFLSIEVKQILHGNKDYFSFDLQTVKLGHLVNFKYHEKKWFETIHCLINNRVYVRIDKRSFFL